MTAAANRGMSPPPSQAPTTVVNRGTSTHSRSPRNIRDGVWDSSLSTSKQPDEDEMDISALISGEESENNQHVDGRYQLNESASSMSLDMDDLAESSPSTPTRPAPRQKMRQPTREEVLARSKSSDDYVPPLPPPETTRPAPRRPRPPSHRGVPSPIRSPDRISRRSLGRVEQHQRTTEVPRRHVVDNRHVVDSRHVDRPEATHDETFRMAELIQEEELMRLAMERSMTDLSASTSNLQGSFTSSSHDMHATAETSAFASSPHLGAKHRSQQQAQNIMGGTGRGGMTGYPPSPRKTPQEQHLGFGSPSGYNRSPPTTAQATSNMSGRDAVLQVAKQNLSPREVQLIQEALHRQPQSHDEHNETRQQQQLQQQQRGVEALPEYQQPFEHMRELNYNHMSSDDVVHQRSIHQRQTHAKSSNDVLEHQQVQKRQDFLPGQVKQQPRRQLEPQPSNWSRMNSVDTDGSTGSLGGDIMFHPSPANSGHKNTTGSSPPMSQRQLMAGVEQQQQHRHGQQQQLAPRISTASSPFSERQRLSNANSPSIMHSLGRNATPDTPLRGQARAGVTPTSPSRLRNQANSERLSRSTFGQHGVAGENQDAASNLAARSFPAPSSPLNRQLRTSSQEQHPVSPRELQQIEQALRNSVSDRSSGGSTGSADRPRRRERHRRTQSAVLPTSIPWSPLDAAPVTPSPSRRPVSREFDLAGAANHLSEEELNQIQQALKGGTNGSEPIRIGVRIRNRASSDTGRTSTASPAQQLRDVDSSISEEDAAAIARALREADEEAEARSIQLALSLQEQDRASPRQRRGSVSRQVFVGQTSPRNANRLERATEGAVRVGAFNSSSPPRMRHPLEEEEEAIRRSPRQTTQAPRPGVRVDAATRASNSAFSRNRDVRNEHDACQEGGAIAYGVREMNGRASLTDAVNQTLTGRRSGVAAHGTGRRGSVSHETTEIRIDSHVRALITWAVNTGLIEKLNRAVKEGNESLVYHADKGDESGGFDVAVKVFKQVQEYSVGGSSSSLGDRTASSREQLSARAEKEYCYLKGANRAGVPVPTPLVQKQNIIFMRFMGTDGWPAALLKEVSFRRGSQQWNILYFQVMESVRRLYKIARLIHGNLGEFSVMVVPSFLVDNKADDIANKQDEFQAVLIDFGRAVDTRHPEARNLLQRDLQNVCAFFARQGIETMGKNEAFAFVVDDIRRPTPAEKNAR